MRVRGLIFSIPAACWRAGQGAESLLVVSAEMRRVVVPMPPGLLQGPTMVDGVQETLHAR
jgi:hypothetical protein